jgi:3',5'-cyclic AMP phosphodiesterase CpdA
MIEPILILHLSDLHFGPNSRFTDIAPEEIGQRFGLAIEKECSFRGIEPKIDLVIVTGDLTEGARVNEYQIVGQFFESVADKLKIDRRRFIFVPGNHDVHWGTCKKIAIDQEDLLFSDEELRKRIDSEKFKNFESFIENFTGISKDLIGTNIRCNGIIVNIEELKLSIASLNSSELESHRKEDHFGRLSEDQAQSLVDKWHETDLNSWIKIIAIHHNPVSTIPENVALGLRQLEKLNVEGKLSDDDFQRFASDIKGFEGRDILERVADSCKVQLILHGHHHAAMQKAWTWFQSKGMTHVLSAGSWGLKQDELPKYQSNNLQLIFLDPEKGEIRAWVLIYNPLVRTEGKVGLGNFASDTINSRGYIQPLYLPESFGTEASKSLDMKIESQNPVNLYYSHPHLLQKHFTGRIHYREMLTKWFTVGEEPVFVITALSGTGKSALTWIWLQHDLLGIQIKDFLSDSSEIEKPLSVEESAHPEGVIWWSFYEKNARFATFLEKVTDKLSEWTNDYSLAPSQHDKLEKLIKLLYEHRFLLILDGFERELQAYSDLSTYHEDPQLDETKSSFRTCVDLHASDFLRQILNPDLRSRVLLTTQFLPKELEGLDRLPITYCKQETLKDLDPSEAINFFKLQGIIGIPSQIEEVCSSYGYHSLTLRLLSGLILHDPACPGNISAASDYNPIKDLVYRKHHILSLAYESPHPNVSELLSRIAAFRSPIDYKKLRLVSNLKKEEELKEAIIELIERGLLLFNRDNGLYDLHPIIRRYAYERLVNKHEVHSILKDHFLKLYRQSEINAKKITRLDELNTVIELYYHTAQMGLFNKAFKIYYDCLNGPLYYRFGAYLVVAELLNVLIAAGEGERVIDEQKRAKMNNDIGLAYSRLGQSRRSIKHYSLAIELVDQLGKKQRSSSSIGRANLAFQLILLGELIEADMVCGRKMEISKNNYANVELHIAKTKLWIYRGEFIKASNELNEFSKLINRIKGITQLKIKVAFYTIRARLYLAKNNLNDAFRMAKQALELCHKLETKYESQEADLIETEWLLGLIMVKMAGNDKEKEILLSEAKIHLQEALTCCRDIDNLYLEPPILLAFSHLYLAESNLKKAKEFANEALYVADRCEFRLYQAEAYNFLSRLALKANDLETAKECAKKAYERALCGNIEYCYKPALDDAKLVLDKLCS